MRKTQFLSVTLGLLLAMIWGAQAALEDGLVSAWTFDDGTARDALGVSDGKLQGGAKIVDNGKFGKAVDVNGVDGFVEIPHAKEYEPLADALSVSAWMFVRQGRDHSAIVFKGNKIGWGAEYLFRIATTSNTGMTWGVCNAGTEGWFATDGVYNTNEWVHVALTADGTTAISYVNAEVKPSGQGNPHAVPGPYKVFPDKPIEIGVGRAVGGTVGNDAYLDGIVDEVYIWNRALSEEEIQALADGERPEGVLAVSAKNKLTTTWAALKEGR